MAIFIRPSSSAAARPAFARPQSGVRTDGGIQEQGKSIATGALSAYGPGMVHTYPPLNLEVRTPRLTLAGATDDLLEQLVPVVRAGIADTAPWPFDDPISFYADSPDREWRWLRAVWAGRARVNESFWRLYLVVLLDGEPIGMQDLIGTEFTKYGTVTTFSWLAPGQRGRGIGTEMRAAVLHLAFAGLGAREAESYAFTDVGSLTATWDHCPVAAMLTVYRLGAEEGRIVLQCRQPLIRRWSSMAESAVSPLPFPPRPGRPVPG
jgi:RimJ/RimL family protein N-acetyltransferase